MKQPIILIPAYNPGTEMLTTLDELRGAGFTRFVIVNDGSRREASRPIFEALEAAEDVDLLVHSVNQGKGRGMKTGFNHILNHYPDTGVIVCDADGQHPLDAILAVGRAMDDYPESLVLGVRNFREGQNVPLPNYLGNMITCFVFRMVTGIRFADTQCGLRGYTPAAMKLLLTTSGERFEFENTMLLAVRTRRIKVVQVPMAAIYEPQENYTTHFNKWKDSFRIYTSIFSFAILPLLGLLLNLILWIALKDRMPAISAAGLSLPSVLLLGTFLGEWFSASVIPSKTAAWIKVVCMTVLHAGLYLGFTALGLSAGLSWFLGGLIQACASYPLWRRLAYGPRAENVRLDG